MIWRIRVLVVSHYFIISILTNLQGLKTLSKYEKIKGWSDTFIPLGQIECTEKSFNSWSTDFPAYALTTELPIPSEVT